MLRLHWSHISDVISSSVLIPVHFNPSASSCFTDYYRSRSLWRVSVSDFTANEGAIAPKGILCEH